jgi:peptidyl-prolyl cis-trans isomerase SurA
VTPKVSIARKAKVIDKLEPVQKKEIQRSSFATKAVLYSQDPGSRAKEVLYNMNRKQPLLKNLKMWLYLLKVRFLPLKLILDYIYVEKIKGKSWNYVIYY